MFTKARWVAGGALLLALVMAIVIACRDERFSHRGPDPVIEAIPAKYAAEREVSLVVESHQPSWSKYRVVRIRLINPTTQTIYFGGYSESNPIDHIEQWSAEYDRWVKPERGVYCGTGLRTCFLRPGESSVFSPKCDEKEYPLRVGIRYRSGKKSAEPDENQPRQEVWTGKIELAELFAKQPEIVIPPPKQ